MELTKAVERIKHIDYRMFISTVINHYI